MSSIQHLSDLYKRWAGKVPERAEQLPGSGSYRQYYRIFGEKGTVVGALNEDDRENQAFLAFSKHFRSEGLPVPEVLAEDRQGCCYLLSDLGDETLFARLTRIRREKVEFTPELVRLYKKVIGWLPLFQVRAGKGIDYGKCYPRAVFDAQSMLWDLNYFKYYFLKLAKIPFDEQKMEDDFETLKDFLLLADADYFMYRDFQSRNVMIIKDEPWFIDYQGGRKGSLQYDVASLLYDAKADIPEIIREAILNHYFEVLEKNIPVDRQQFSGHFYGFVLIRILQALGAYGFRGYYENKPHFLQSVPYALKNLQFMIETGKIPVRMPALVKALERIITEFKISTDNQIGSSLTVVINSFSYKSGIPSDNSGNGGGYVFDCRALPNPGRYDEYRLLTGKDQAVIEFLKKERAVDEFIKHAFSLIDQSVRTYIERGFTHLQVSFGCTGGQHRSVYCAEELARHLKERYSANVEVKHTEMRG